MIKKFTRSSWKKFVRFLKIQVWIQRIRFKSFKSWYFLDLIYKVLARIYPLLTTFIAGLVINEIVYIATHADKDLTKMFTILGFSFGLSFFKRIVDFFYNRNSWLQGDYQFNVYLETAIIDKLTELNWEHIETPVTEKNINMTFQRAWFHIGRVSDIHLDILSIIISIIFAFKVASITPLIILLLVLKELPAALLQAFDANRQYKLTDRLQQKSIQAGNILNFFRDFKTLLEVKLSLASLALKDFRHKLESYLFSEYKKSYSKTAIIGFLLNATDSLVESGIYLFYILKVIYSEMQIGTFQYTTGTILQVSDSIGRLLQRGSSMYESYKYIKYAYNFLTLENETVNGTRKLEGDTVVIEFRNVWFRYPQSKKWALKDVSIKIEDNDRLALVGENGAGKTTFLKLLTLAYYPTKGEILINDIPLNEYDKESLYRAISLVTQDFARYTVLTAAQNIAIYGDINEPDMEKVKTAAKLATADGFIEELSAGYDTYLTKKLEGGTELSTGQWQRIAVARQFYGDRPLVILDEPTASIDPIAEVTIFNNLYHHVVNKTVIVVSHRYNTVRAAKKILVFNAGKIIERGTHEELLSLNGYYAKAYGMQQEEKKL